MIIRDVLTTGDRNKKDDYKCKILIEEIEILTPLAHRKYSSSDIESWLGCDKFLLEAYRVENIYDTMRTSALKHCEAWYLEAIRDYLLTITQEDEVSEDAQEQDEFKEIERKEKERRELLGIIKRLREENDYLKSSMIAIIGRSRINE